MVHRLLNPPSQIERVHPRRDGLAPLVVDGTREDGGGGGTISCDVVGFGCDGFDELGAHVFEFVLEVDGFCDGDSVLCDFWWAVWLSDDCIASFRSEGYLLMMLCLWYVDVDVDVDVGMVGMIDCGGDMYDVNDCNDVD